MADNDNGKDVQTHDHQRVEVRSWCPDCGKELGHHTFNRGDLQEQQAAELPQRDSMSLVNANVAAPINAALALNVLSDGSIANATAQQVAPIGQSSGAGSLTGGGSGGLLGGL
jgi:hypothetical protein